MNIERKESLLNLVKDNAKYFQGSDLIGEFSEGQLLDQAKEIIEDEEMTYLLPEDAVVFWVHQGYAFSYFRMSGEDDPEVYTFTEASPFCISKSGKLSEVIEIQKTQYQEALSGQAFEYLLNTTE